MPNTAFTEALAFVFQAHDLELLGLAKPDAEAQRLRTLNDFWATYEIAGVALVDMAVWHWMYDHPDATPAQLSEAVVQIAQDVWNKLLRAGPRQAGRRAARHLLAHDPLLPVPARLPDRPPDRVPDRGADREGRATLGAEFERMARIGAVTPDLWMRKATGAPVGPQALLRATEAALKDLNAKR